MFDGLQDKFGRVLKFVSGHGKLTESNIAEAAEKLKFGLLEADVHYAVVKEFIAAVKVAALDRKVLDSMTPARTFRVLVRQELVKLLSGGIPDWKPQPGRTNKLVLFGANGSGKTTMAVKLARRFREYDPLVVALDTTRPAAREQLAVLCEREGIPVHADREEKDLLRIVRKVEARASGHRLVIYDTAGRFDTDAFLMEELKGLISLIEPHYAFLVADSQEGQRALDAVLKTLSEVRIDGLILTKTDSDARGGIILSVRQRTGLPVLFCGTGEKMQDLEVFDPGTFTDRILGDLRPDGEAWERVAGELAGRLESEALPAGDSSEKMDLDQFSKSLSILGDGAILRSLAKVLPGLPAGFSPDSGETKRYKAILSSMTPWERKHPERIDHRRRLRIARGSGVDVRDVNILLKRFFSVRDMMKKFGKKKNMSWKDMLGQFQRR